MMGCKKDKVESDSIHEFYNGTFEVEINDTLITPKFATISSKFQLYSNINGTDSSVFDFGSSYEGFNQKNSIYINIFSHFPNSALIQTNTGQNLSNNTFSQLFNLGSHTYTYIALLNSGVIVTWYDDKAISWTSGKYKVNDTVPLMHPNYSRNNFVIKYSISESTQEHYKQRVQASFDCWVYNSSGDSLHLKNAKYNGIFEY
jgi:hypothetical protein